MNKWFNDFATKMSALTGRSYAFVGAATIIIVWLISGPLMKFSDTWQLMINTLTTLVTFLMVFLIQNSQNRSTNSTQIKLDFILQALGVDSKDVRELETLDDKRLDEILKDVQKGTRKESGGRKARRTN